MEQFNTVVNQNLGWVHENKYVLPVLSLFLGMYAALARPKLPNFIAKLFENPVFRLVMISYIIYRGNKDPQLSLMIAAAFLITMHMINKQQVEAISLHDTDSTANSVAGGLGRLAQICYDENGNQVACGPGRLAQNDNTGNAVAGGLGRF